LLSKLPSARARFSPLFPPRESLRAPPNPFPPPARGRGEKDGSRRGEGERFRVACTLARELSEKHEREARLSRFGLHGSRFWQHNEGRESPRRRSGSDLSCEGSRAPLFSSHTIAGRAPSHVFGHRRNTGSIRMVRIASLSVFHLCLIRGCEFLSGGANVSMARMRRVRRLGAALMQSCDESQYSRVLQNAARGDGKSKRYARLGSGPRDWGFSAVFPIARGGPDGAARLRKGRRDWTASGECGVRNSDFGMSSSTNAICVIIWPRMIIYMKFSRILRG
jgi:hypothetical protein